jgi:iron complex transport system substrate-binding protein
MKDSHEGRKPRRDAEELSAIVVDCAYRIHVEAGPGLLESVCEVVLAKMTERGLRLLKLPLGLLINFGAPTFKDGCRRIVNGPQSFVSSRLRVNQNQALAAYVQ